jgi:prephenate dehydrogenase
MTEPPFRSAAIVGLGLVGGSLARDLTARGVRVRGYDRDAAAVRAASGEAGVEPMARPADFAAADIVIVATPIDQALEFLRANAASLKQARLVSDVCSTKETIVRAAEACGLGERFVGSHPMAGHHTSGWAASRGGLFTGARTYLCATSATAPAAMSLAVQLWKLVGADPERIDPASHDRQVAWTSHLPHVVSAALGAALARARFSPALLGPGGRDVTRLAGADPELWTGIALDNATPLTESMDALMDQLRAMRESLARQDRSLLFDHFATASAWAGGD